MLIGMPSSDPIGKRSNQESCELAGPNEFEMAKKQEGNFIKKCHEQSSRKRNFLGRSSIKNQSAMEYLMTYGWAILIIAVVLVALFQMGVFNSANFAPKAQPGSCQVFKTVASTSLEGTCNNELPQYVAHFSGASNILMPNSNLQMPVTVTGWVNPTGTSTQFVYYDGAATGYPQFGVYIYSEIAAECPSQDVYPTLPVTPNSFNFFAVTFTSTNTIFYLNSKTQTVSVTCSDTPGTYISVIGQKPSGSFSLSGSVSNIQIYNTSLSASDVASLYYEGIGGVPQDIQNLVGWWPLNGNANDYSGNNNNGAATNVIYSGSWTNGYSAP